jgi:DHA1 family bicyclomycin/chloramphenicol resistance-like MFS transporter
MIVFGLAPAIAPIVGGWLQATLGWRSIFLCIAFFSLVLLIACVRWLPETLPPARRHAFHFRVIVTNYWRVARHARFMVQSLAAGLSFIGVMLYVSSAPAFIFNILHLSETEFAWLFVPQIAGMMLGSMTAGRLSHRWSAAAIIRLGFSIMAVAAAANILYCRFFTVAVPWAVIPIFFYAGGVAIVNPPMSVETLELFPNVRGLASSLMAFFFMILFSIASGLIAPLLFGHALSLAFGMAGGAALSLFFWTVGKRLSLGEPVHVIPD